MAVRNKVTQNFEKIPKSFFLNVAAAGPHLKKNFWVFFQNFALPYSEQPYS